MRWDDDDDDDDDDDGNDEMIMVKWEFIFKMIACKIFHHKYKSNDIY